MDLTRTIVDGDKMTIVFEDVIISCVVTGVRLRTDNGEQLHLGRTNNGDPAQHERLMQPQIPTEPRAEAEAARSAIAAVLPPCAASGVVVEAVAVSELER